LALAGAVLKFVYARKVILAIDMRDPWTFHMSLGGIPAVKLWLEGKVLRKADYLSTVSYGLRDEFVETHGVSMEVFYNIASHYASSDEKETVDWSALNAAISGERIKLVYTGSTPQTYYDLASLAQGILGLREHHPKAADRIQFIFVGACGELQKELNGRNAGTNDVIFVPHVSQRLARSIQQGADILLFLTYLGRGAVSTKIFEYMALGKPIFPVSVIKGSDADQLLSKYCRTCLYLHSSGEIEQALMSLSSDGHVDTLPRLTDPSALQPLLEGYRGYAKHLLSPA
jgi:glycosyltransferase involved in cell wall biosynthesis